MRFTEEMKAEDERRWHARDVLIELGYCSEYIMDRKHIRNDDLRFYAFLMRKALELLKEQEPLTAYKMINSFVIDYQHVEYPYMCCQCHAFLLRHWKACPICGKKVKWEDD